MVKSVIYRFQPRGLLDGYNMNLGYIFHTEKIYDLESFRQLKEFCVRYSQMTNAQPICTIIPPTNYKLKLELAEAQFSEDHFTDRLIELAEVATLGYHGHFYLNQSPEYINAIHCQSYNQEDLIAQYQRDIEWFESKNISTNGIYAGGWWFTNKVLIQMLVDSGFECDFTFTQLKYFYNHYSANLMMSNRIQAGENFYLSTGGHPKLLCIQNLIACHDSPFPQDFVRNMKSLLSGNVGDNNITGVINSHDYDLDFNYTIECVNFLLENTNVAFHSFTELVELAKRVDPPLKIISA